MRNIKLFGRQNRPGNAGPENGMYALQKALLANKPDWFDVVGEFKECAENDLVWFWNWQDKGNLMIWAGQKRPFVCGPNILFEYSGNPCGDNIERFICLTPHCRTIFTESRWYADLIRHHLLPENNTPIILWPYPIDPMPPEPAGIEYDLLVYAKSGPVGIVDQLAQVYPRSKIIHYGNFRREELGEIARRSKCCLYLSDDDRGPLALAEILLCGCPAVGIERGAPWVNERTGKRIERLELPDALGAVKSLVEVDYDRAGLRNWALNEFSPTRVAGVVIDALDDLRRQ